MQFLRRITTQLILLVLAVAVPLTALIGYLIYANAREANSRAVASVHENAHKVAEEIDVFLQRRVEHLEFLSKRPAVRFADPTRCDPLIVELQRMNASIYVNVIVVGTSGEVLCWSMNRAIAGASYADREWFRSAMGRTSGFRAEPPVIGRFTGELVAPLTMPLANDEGRTIGVLTFATSLREISRLVESRQDVVPGSLVTVVSAEGTIIARSLEPEKWLGRDGRSIPAVAAQLERKEGVETLIGADGVARIVAFTTLPRTGWVVSTGIPVEALTANVRTNLARGIIAAVLVTAAALGIAFFSARRIREPVRTLADAAQAFGRGDSSARALETGPIEIVAVAREFNRVNEVRARVEAEARVLAVSRYARNLLEASLDPLVTINSEGKITDLNDATVKATGVPRGELIGTEFSKYFTDPQQADHGYRMAFENGLITDYPLTIRHRNGQLTDVLYNATVYRDDAGAVLGVFAAARDVTAHKRAEATARQLAAIVESSDDAIIGVTLDGRISTWNAGAELLYGYRAKEIIGRPILTLVPADKAGEEGKILERVLAGEQVSHYATVRLRKDGSPVDISLTVSPIRSETGTIVGLSKTARDITNSKRAEAVIRELNATLDQRVRDRTAQLETSSRELAEFTYSLAHDLRTPLRSIDGFAKALEEDCAEHLDADGKDALHRVRGAAQRMGELIDDLLKLPRLARSEIIVESVDLSALARAVADTLRQSNPGRSVSFEIPPQLEARGDRRLLAVALENLLGNAWKFTARHASARIELGVTEQNGERAYFVRDDGAGFDMAHVASLFTPFGRLHSVGEFPGTGIGLATVRRIVQRHGGRIWAEGAPDQGATFYFTLPDSSPLPRASGHAHDEPDSRSIAALT